MVEAEADDRLSRERLPVGGAGRRASGWWGMWALIATEASLFAYLLFSYLYLAAWAHGRWVPELPKLSIPGVNTAVLIGSSLVLWWGEKGIRQGKRSRLLFSLAVTLAMGLAFIALQGVEWHNKKFTLGQSAYASTFFVTTGFHMAHVIGGLLVLLALLTWTWLGKFNEKRHAAVSIGALYWHFVDVVWLSIFATFYLSPYLTS